MRGKHYADIREPGESLLASFEPEGANLHYYHFDALGSTVLVTNGSGTVSDAYAYDAWGNALSGGDGLKPYQYVGQLGYYSHTSAQGDALEDLMQLGVRFYDPVTGRFTQRDPITQLGSMYSYADNMPTTNVDPTGLAAAAPQWPKLLGCSAEQEKMIRAAVKFLLGELGHISGGKALQQCLKDRLTNNGYIRCSDASTEQGCVGRSSFIELPTPRKHVHLCAPAFKDKNQAAKGIIHEFAHSCIMHPKPTYIEPPEGWQCEWDIFQPRKGH